MGQSTVYMCAHMCVYSEYTEKHWVHVCTCVCILSIQKSTGYMCTHVCTLEYTEKHWVHVCTHVYTLEYTKKHWVHVHTCVLWSIQKSTGHMCAHMCVLWRPSDLQPWHHDPSKRLAKQIRGPASPPQSRNDSSSPQPMLHNPSMAFTSPLAFTGAAPFCHLIMHLAHCFSPRRKPRLGSHSTQAVCHSGTHLKPEP